MKQPSIDEITGHLAVGSVLIGGVALVVQSFSDVKAFLAWLTGLAAWGVIMAIPVMFMSYIIGLLTIRLASWWFEHRHGETPASRATKVLLIGHLKSEFVASEYARTVREFEVLQGAYPATLCLVGGLVVKLFRAAPDIGGHLRGGRLILAFVAVVLVAVAILLKTLAARQYAHAQALIAAVESLSHAGGESAAPANSLLRLSG